MKNKKILVVCVILISFCFSGGCSLSDNKKTSEGSSEVLSTIGICNLPHDSGTETKVTEFSDTTMLETVDSETTITKASSATEENNTTKKDVETTVKKATTTKPTATGFPLTYSDNTCSIVIERKWYENAWCYIATLKFSDYSRFGTAPANGAHLNGLETTSGFANRYGAVFAVNCDYACPETGNTAVRSGVVYTDKNCYVPAVYNAHTGVFDSPSNLGITGELFSTLVAEKKVTDSFTFWSWSLVKNGEVVPFDDSSRAQRTSIGSNGNPGEIIIVVSEGRYADGESAGLTFTQCGRLMKELGCVTAVPLDGGGSSTMYFNGKVINSAKGQERAIRDFVYFK